MLRAAVPEAAIYENGDTLTPENEVCRAPERRHRRTVEAVAQSEGVQRPPQGHFRPCALTPLGAHA
jgi:hypothetical protein